MLVMPLAAGVYSQAAFATCPDSIPYKPIQGVPQTVNDLGKMFAQEQCDVVTPGGSEYSPGFSDDDRTKFQKSGDLEKVIARVKDSATFKTGVAIIRKMSADQRAAVFTAYERPLYLTWGMNGRIDDNGTTNAGYDVELEIAKALTNAVKKALQ